MVLRWGRGARGGGLGGEWSGAVSYWAAEDLFQDVAVAVGLVLGAVAEDRDGAVLGEALE